jgi:hypothetical protein
VWLFRIILGIFYIWLGYWITYNVSAGECDPAIITFMWIVGVTKIIFCMKEQYPSVAFVRPILIITLSIIYCPDIFTMFFALAFIFVAGSVMMAMSTLSFLFRGAANSGFPNQNK